MHVIANNARKVGQRCAQEMHVEQLERETAKSGKTAGFGNVVLGVWCHRFVSIGSMHANKSVS